METKTVPQLMLVSGACCSPNMIKLDQVLEKNLDQALKDLGFHPEVRKVSLSAIINDGGELTTLQREQIMSLFQAYGAKFTPAFLIGDEVCFAGKPPSVDQLKEVLQEIVTLHP